MITRKRLFITCLSFSFLPLSSALAQDPCLECVRDAQSGAAWCEDFEIASGPNGACYDTQNCTVEPEIPTACNDWRPWFDDEAVHAVIGCDQNLTPGGEQSMAIDTDDDQVRFFVGYDNIASDFWIITSNMFVPSNMSGTAFWIVNPDYSIDGSGTTTWAIAMEFSSDGTFVEQCGSGGGGAFPTDQWFEILLEVNLAADTVRILVDDQFTGFHGWTDAPGGGCGLGGSLQIEAIDLFSSGATRFYYDDISVCPAEVPSLLAPELRCQTIDRLESGCVDYFFSLTNVNAADPISEFWVDLEAGDGGVICTGAEDITPPAGWTAELCAGWTDGHGLIRFFDGLPIPVGGAVTGRVRVDPNGPTPTVTPTGFDVPAFSVLMHAAQTAGNPDAACDGSFDFGPTTQNPVECIDNTDCEDFQVDCVGGFCEGVLRGSTWSAPTNVCTAFLPVPAMTSMAKVLLTAMLIGGGALLVLRGRRGHVSL